MSGSSLGTCWRGRGCAGITADPKSSASSDKPKSSRLAGVATQAQGVDITESQLADARRAKVAHKAESATWVLGNFC